MDRLRGPPKYKPPISVGLYLGGPPKNPTRLCLARLCLDRRALPGPPKKQPLGLFFGLPLRGSPLITRSGPARNPPGPALYPTPSLIRAPDSVRTCSVLTRPRACRLRRAPPLVREAVSSPPTWAGAFPLHPLGRALPGTLGPDRPRAQSVAISRLGVPPKNPHRASPAPARAGPGPAKGVPPLGILGRGPGSPSTLCSHRALPGTLGAGGFPRAPPSRG